MSRRNGLAVALRLARIEERQALQRLGAARVRCVALEARLETLEALRTQTRGAINLAAGSRIGVKVENNNLTKLY